MRFRNFSVHNSSNQCFLARRKGFELRLPWSGSVSVNTLISPKYSKREGLTSTLYMAKDSLHMRRGFSFAKLYKSARAVRKSRQSQ